MTLPETTETVAQPNLTALPASSLLRLYDEAHRGNSFSLDGFPSFETGEDWLEALVAVIERQGAISMTTNQTLFRGLMDAGALDERLRALKEKGQSASTIYWTLYNEAATRAARAFGWIHARWSWEGRVSQEASALLTEAQPLFEDVCRIAKAMSGVGAFTKIPNLPVGPQVIEQALIGDSATQIPSVQVNPNITLVFSDRHYLETVAGTLAGLKQLAENLKAQGLDEAQVREFLGKIHSVNSLFVSRMDRAVDPLIDEQIESTQDADTKAQLQLLKGKVAVAHAKKVYQIFEAIFLGKPFTDSGQFYGDEEGQAIQKKIQKLAQEFKALEALGAQPQRLLVASTGVKSDQPYSPLLYVLPFLGPWVVNTLPEKTLQASSQFVETLSEETTQALRVRSIISESLPAIPTDSERERWDQALLMSAEERKAQGIESISADEILSRLQQGVLTPQKKSLRQIADELRDKGAASFTDDEEATLAAIETKLSSL